MRSTKTPTKVSRGTVRKKSEKLDEAQKRKEAANALLTMTKIPKAKGPPFKQKGKLMKQPTNKYSGTPYNSN